MKINCDYCRVLADFILSGERFYQHPHPVAFWIHIIALVLAIALAVCGLIKHFKKSDKKDECND